MTGLIKSSIVTVAIALIPEDTVLFERENVFKLPIIWRIAKCLHTSNFLKKHMKQTVQELQGTREEYPSRGMAVAEQKSSKLHYHYDNWPGISKR